ncbi:MAG: phosphonate ABC transporter ATP-binding protein, partial [Paracoccus sp. (in: a-proteobacteria)]
GHYCDRVIGMRDGEVVFDGTADELTASVAREIYGAGDSFNEAATSTSIPADAKADDPAWSQPAYAAAMVS